METFLFNKKAVLKAAWKSSPDLPPLSLPPPPARTGRPRQAVATSLARQARLIDLYHQIQALAANQVRVSDIAAQLHICRLTVYRYLQMEQPPELPSPQDRRSLPLDRYKPYLLQRWNEGIRNSKQLWREVVAQGYSQSSAPVQRFVGALRQQTGQPHKFKQAGVASLYAPEEACQRPLTPPQAARLLCSQEPARHPWQQTYLTRLCASDEAIAQTYRLVQAFGTLVRDRPGAAPVEQWLAEVEQCGIPPLLAFAEGVKKDEEAVLAGLTLEWSNDHVAYCTSSLRSRSL